MTPDVVTEIDDTEEHPLDAAGPYFDSGEPPPPPPATPAPAAPSRVPRWLAAVVAVSVLGGAGAGAGVSALMRDDSKAAVTSASSSGGRNSSVITKASDVQGILSKVGPAVAYVRT